MNTFEKAFHLMNGPLLSFSCRSTVKRQRKHEPANLNIVFSALALFCGLYVLTALLQGDMWHAAIFEVSRLLCTAGGIYATTKTNSSKVIVLCFLCLSVISDLTLILYSHALTHVYVK